MYCKQSLIHWRNLARISLAALLAINLSGCFVFCKPAKSTVDPYEKFNRQMFQFNMSVDQVVYKPVAKFYDAAVPPQYNLAVHNFFSNLDEIPSVANDLLQADLYHATADTWRLIINSTLGVAGLMDVAKHTGLRKHQNDLGITLVKWGVKKSPYVVIPFLGPSTIRDSFGYVVNYFAFTVYPHLRPPVRYSLLGLTLVQLRAELLPTDQLVHQAFDPYVFVRDAYLQNRQEQIQRVLGAEKSDHDTFIAADEDATANNDYHSNMGLPAGTAQPAAPPAPSTH